MDAPKPGYKTSEFYLTVLSTLLALLNQSGLLGHPLPTEAIMSLAAMVATYTASRTMAKK